MADKKISQLASSTTFGDADEIAINRGGVSKKSTGLMVSTYIGSPLQSQITTNTANIATNTTNLTATIAATTTNTTSIATNATNIAVTTGTITANTTSIVANTGNISTNTAGIATNVTAIAAIPNVNTLYPLLGTNTTELLFFGTGTNIAQDVNLVWDNVGKRLGIGDSTIALFPEANLHIKGTVAQSAQVTSTTATAILIADGATAVSNSASFGLKTNGVGKWQIATDPTSSDKFKISPSALTSYALGIDHASGNVEIRNGADLEFQNTLNTKKISLKAPGALAVDKIYTLPMAAPTTANMALTSAVSGTLSFRGMPLTTIGFDTGAWTVANVNINSFSGVTSGIVALDGALQTHLSVVLTNTSTSLIINNMPNMINGMEYTVLIKNAGAGNLDTTPGNHGSELRFLGNAVPVITGGTGTLYLLKFTASVVGGVNILLCEKVGQFGA